MGAAGHRLRGFFPGRLCFGGVVHGLGEEARVCALRGVSDCGGNPGTRVRGEARWLSAGNNLPFQATSEQPPRRLRSGQALGCSAERSSAERLAGFWLSGCLSKPQALAAPIQSLRNIWCFAETTG